MLDDVAIMNAFAALHEILRHPMQVLAFETTWKQAKDWGFKVEEMDPARGIRVESVGSRVFVNSTSNFLNPLPCESDPNYDIC